ncbi:hypothetical protein VCHE09_0680 [Vibrio paracholerae HE-09]|nr:hypothetical protein VCHE09_0680 [Vibrio paracholerae HE-09]
MFYNDYVVDVTLRLGRGKLCNELVDRPWVLSVYDSACFC